MLEGLKGKKLNTFPDEFISTFRDILNLNKLYEHIHIEKTVEDIDLTNDDENDVSAYYKEEHHELIEKIKKYCFYFCKTFKENEELLEALCNLEATPSHDFSKFMYAIDDLRDIFLMKFETTAEEKLQWKKNLQQLQKEEIELQEEEKQLNKELEKIRIKNQKELTALKNIYTKKENELNDLKKDSEEKINNLLDMLPKNDSCTELENINILYEKTKDLYENQLQMYQDKEISSIKKNSLLETDIKNYIDSIDAEIKKKNAEIKKYQKELKKNKLTEKELDNIIQKNEKDEEEKQHLNELADRRKRIMQKEYMANTEAAIIIQSYIRAIMQRSLFVEHQKKMKKKDKKK